MSDDEFESENILPGEPASTEPAVEAIADDDAISATIESDDEELASPAAEPETDDLAELAAAARTAIPQDPIYRRISVVPRIIAAVIDMVLVGLLVLGVWIVDNFTGLLENFVRQFREPAVDSLMLLFPTLWLLYTTTEIFGAATPGKSIVAIRIASTNFTPASRKQRLQRWMIRRTSAIVMLVFVLLYVAQRNAPITVFSESFFESAEPVTALLQIPLIIAFLFCGGRNRLALYDRLLGTAVIDDMDLKRSRARAFTVVARPPGT